MTPAFAADERGISRVLGYILSVAIATALVAGLLISTSGFVDRQTEAATETELRVAGDKLAAQLMQADHVAQQDPSSSFVLDPDIPAEAGGRQYAIEVADSGDELILTSEEEGVEVSVPMTIETDVDGTRTLSGDLLIVYDGSELTVVREVNR